MGGSTLGQALDTKERVQAFLAARAGVVAPATMRTDRWALMLLADAHETLPTSTPTLSAFMAAQEPYLSGCASMQRVWDTLRLFYDWLRGEGVSAPRLPYVFYGRRRRGERRGRRRVGPKS